MILTDKLIGKICLCHHAELQGLRNMGSWSHFRRHHQSLFIGTFQKMVDDRSRTIGSYGAGGAIIDGVAMNCKQAIAHVAFVFYIIYILRN